jgi:hypothetical protein
MFDRFTHETKMGRGNISKSLRHDVYERDNHTCQYCQRRMPESELSIDHLVPLSLGGLDEKTNYVTCCRACNGRKSNIPLPEFLARLNIPVERLPVHGDPVIDNEALPIEIRIIRRRIFDSIRGGDLAVSGKQAQKKIEKEYRRSFWETPEGQRLEGEFPLLPGHARVMIPEIKTLASSVYDFLLLVELAKSANTRNLINSSLGSTDSVHEQVLAIRNRSTDQALVKRIDQAFTRYEQELRRRNIAMPKANNTPEPIVAKRAEGSV